MKNSLCESTKSPWRSHESRINKYGRRALRKRADTSGNYDSSRRGGKEIEFNKLKDLLHWSRRRSIQAHQKRSLPHRETTKDAMISKQHLSYMCMQSDHVFTLAGEPLCSKEPFSTKSIASI